MSHLHSYLWSDLLSDSDNLPGDVTSSISMELVRPSITDVVHQRDGFTTTQNPKDAGFVLKCGTFDRQRDIAGLLDGYYLTSHLIFCSEILGI